jgi:hypothetical protein
VINWPTDGIKVTREIVIHGVMNRTYANLWVIVRPEKYSIAWVQPPVHIRTDGVWTCQAFIGDDRTQEGTQFEIKAIVNPPVALHRGMILSIRLDAEVISPSITVTRINEQFA